MLNLSDKDLDRLSKEAAQEYEPGEILGPNSWEKLEIRLDSDLGRFSPNPLRHIRRFPFYYAPALLVLLGISYYYLTKHPPSSPDMVKNSSTNQISTNPTNTTPSTHPSANPTAPEATSRNATTGASAGRVTTSSAPTTDATTSGATTSGTATGSAATTDATTGGATTSSALTTGATTNSATTKNATTSSTTTGSATTSSIAHNKTAGGAKTRPNNHLSSHSGAPASFSNRPSSYSGAPTSNNRPSSHSGVHPYSPNATTPHANSSNPTASQTPSSNPTTTTQQTHELLRSKIGGLGATKIPADISDSALRAFTLKSMPPPPIKRALYIKRNWQFGLMAAPDFASVNSLAGDKPGSSIGITVDYQFAPRWYISSGLLLDRRNYAARSEDFHAPNSFYSSNGIPQTHLDFVKGSLQMLEVPLNLRYDFSVTGSTLFFASAGVSSYLLASENGNCYVHWLNGEIPKGFQYPGSDSYLFSAMNLSLGVETGLSNSMSLLIAPYLKMPLGPIGLGQLQMNSVGISFSVKWAPVTSRRRR